MFKKITGFVIAICILSGLYFTFVTHDLQQGYFAPALLSITSAIVIFAVGAAWYFLTGLNTFQPQFRLGYYFLCAGILFLAAAQAQFPILTLTNAFSGWWVSTGIVILPYFLSTVFLYIGVLRMAHVLQLKPLAGRWWLVSLVAITAAIGSSFIPHLRIVSAGGAETSFDVFTGLLVINMTFSAASYFVSKRIGNQLGLAYKPAMKWLGRLYFYVIFAGLTEYLYSFLFPVHTWYTAYGINAAPLLITSFITLIAGLHFRNISAKQFNADATFSDIVIAAANMSSDQKRVQPALNTIKAINAVLSRGEEPSPAQKKVLASVYLDIENSLIADDQVRKFSREELRAMLPPNFINMLDEVRNTPAQNLY